jgi:RNA polymerase sigma factor (sigma-70 family)
MRTNSAVLPSPLAVDLSGRLRPTATALDKRAGNRIMMRIMLPSIHRDRMLVGQILEGNVRSWQRFILDYSVFIYSAVVRYTGDEDEKTAVYLQILEKLRENDFERLRRFAFQSSLSTWLTAVSRTMAIDFLRSKYGRDFRLKKIKVLPLANLDGPADTAPDRQPEAAYQNREREEIRGKLQAELETAMKELDAREALLIQLVYFKGFKIRDAGQILKIGSAYKFLQWTLRKIGNRLTAESPVSREEWDAFFSGDANE